MQQVVQEIKNLSIGFTSKKGQQISILKNINTKIKKGETVGIVGESGSGKSTLALAMMGYVKHGLYTISVECLYQSNKHCLQLITCYQYLNIHYCQLHLLHNNQ